MLLQEDIADGDIDLEELDKRHKPPEFSFSGFNENAIKLQKAGIAGILDKKGRPSTTINLLSDLYDYQFYLKYNIGLPVCKTCKGRGWDK